MTTHWSVLLFAFGGTLLIIYAALVRFRLLPRQRIPAHYQLLAWLGLLAIAGAVCFAMAAFMTEH